MTGWIWRMGFIVMDTFVFGRELAKVPITAPLLGPITAPGAKP
jgi:hypothetical protein